MNYFFKRLYVYKCYKMYISLSKSVKKISLFVFFPRSNDVNISRLIGILCEYSISEST